MKRSTEPEDDPGLGGTFRRLVGKVWGRDRRATQGEALPIVESPEKALAPTRPADRLISLQPRNVVYVVGRTGVGKSTLINALIQDGFGPLPQGGIGSLTALKVQVRYSAAPYFRVRYKSSSFVRGLVDSLRSGAPRAEDLKRARQLIDGSPLGSSSPAELAASIERVLSGNRDTDDPENPAHVALRGIQKGRLVETTHLNGDRPLFTHSLTRHVAGPLAAIVDDVEVGWESDLLRSGVWLVDLPGTGTAQDAFVETSRRELRAASTVLLVVDRSGIDEGAIRVLRESGFLARHLGAAERSSETTLLTAIVALEQPTRDYVQELKAENAGKVAWSEAYRVVANKAVTAVDRHLRGVLEAEQRRAGLAIRIPGVTVLAALPRDHQQHHVTDEEHQPRLAGPEGTGLPALREALKSVAATVPRERSHREVDEHARPRRDDRS